MGPEFPRLHTEKQEQYMYYAHVWLEFPRLHTEKTSAVHLLRLECECLLFSSNHVRTSAMSLIMLDFRSWPFRPIWCHARPKNNANDVSRWFSDMSVQKLSLTPPKIRYFGQKAVKSGPKIVFFYFGQIMDFLVHLVPCPT